jgi:hypothetical protein
MKVFLLLLVCLYLTISSQADLLETRVTGAPAGQVVLYKGSDVIASNGRCYAFTGPLTGNKVGFIKKK